MTEHFPDPCSGDEFRTLPPDGPRERATPVSDAPVPDTRTYASPGQSNEKPALLPDFLDTVQMPAGPPAAPAPLTGSNYQVVRELGRGGMGVVYLTRQVGLNRLVALKMILSGEYARPEEIKRFRNEAEAVAQLKHPNIVHIYDTGEEAGRPYFAMELADAGSLADRLPGSPLPARDAARLLETLARAMYHAHLNGIVHRDLKPVNVLLSTSGNESLGEINLESHSPDRERLPLAVLVPKITDFGLAKRMDSKGRTVSGRVVGTVNYMAPEQAEGRSRDVGPCSDIYGLGAILYECLTGRPPFHADTLIATLELVRTQEPQPIHEINPSCPRDLETICHKCLEKDPGRRYATALELAEDLRALLEDRPIKARPVSTWERIWRAVQRRRRETVWVSCAVLAILVYAGYLWRQSVLSNLQRQQVRDEYLLAVEALRGTGETLAGGAIPSEQLERLLRELPRHYQQVQQHVDAVGLQEQAAQACRDLGESLWKQGRKDEASDAGKVAQVLYGVLLESDRNNSSHRHALAQVRLRQGQIRAAFRDYKAAEDEFRAALSAHQQLAADDPDNLDYQRHLAEVHHQFGELSNTRKERRRAVEFYNESLKIREKLAKAQPGRRDFLRDLARSHGYLGDAWLEMNEEKKAWLAYAEAERIRKELVDSMPADADARFQLARSYANEGFFGLWIGDVSRSLQGFARAKLLQEKLLAENPGMAEYATDLGWSLLSMAGLMLDRDGSTSEVLQLLEQAHELFTERSSASDADRSNTRNLARSEVGLALYYREQCPWRTRESLDAARYNLERVRTADRQQRRVEDPDDLYQLALLETLEGSLLCLDREKERWVHADRAMSRLDLAICYGFTRATRLGRSVRGLELVWQTDERRMTALVERCRAAARPER